MKFQIHATAVVVACALSACVAPNSQYATLSVEEAERNRAYTERIERVGREQQHEDRMSQAAASEVATRHAPSSVSTTTVIAPRF